MLNMGRDVVEKTGCLYNDVMPIGRSLKNVLEEIYCLLVKTLPMGRNVAGVY